MNDWAFLKSVSIFAFKSLCGKFSAPNLVAIAFLSSPFNCANAAPALLNALSISSLNSLLSNTSLIFWFASAKVTGLVIVDEVLAIVVGFVITLSTLLGNSSSSDKSS